MRLAYIGVFSLRNSGIDSMCIEWARNIGYCTCALKRMFEWFYCGRYRQMFMPKHSRHLVLKAMDMAQVQSCITLTKQLFEHIFLTAFSSFSFQILTKLWFGSLDENLEGLVLNI